jgi:hypothetical protein
MKLGYVALKMAVDVYIIREYEQQESGIYKCRDIIKFQVKDGVISNIQIDENPRLQGIHEDYARFNKSLDGIEHILKKAFYYVFMGGHISTGKIE